MKPYAERVAMASERRISLDVKLDPCGHHNCAVSAGCGRMADCCEHCPLPDCSVGDGVRSLNLSASEYERIGRNKAVVELRMKGKPVEDIAEGFGMSKRNVWHVLATAKVPLTDTPQMC